MTAVGLITLPSPFEVPATVARLTAALAAKGITLFATIDHGAGAAGVGMALRPTLLLIFGNPAAGTPLMQADQRAGLDLPLKVLIWQDEAGMTQVSYNDPVWIAERHHLGSATADSVTALSQALTALVRAATT